MAKPPAHEIRIGLIKATIWGNHSKHGVNYVVTFVRLFKNGTEWKESTRFGRDDLLVASKIADLAHSWIVAKQQGQIEDEASNGRKQEESKS